MLAPSAATSFTSRGHVCKWFHLSLTLWLVVISLRSSNAFSEERRLGVIPVRKAERHHVKTSVSQQLSDLAALQHHRCQRITTIPFSQTLQFLMTASQWQIQKSVIVSWWQKSLRLSKGRRRFPSSWFVASPSPALLFSSVYLLTPLSACALVTLLS